MIQKFQDEADGKRRLVDSLRRLELVRGDEDLAEALADVADLEEHPPESILLEQGGNDDHLVLILSGEVKIIANGREIAIRKSRQHVGEMALIDPTAQRSASVVCSGVSDTLIAKISEPDFSRIAERHPDLWRRLALELGDRLRQRSQHIRTPNPVPIVFVGSSVEHLDVARSIKDDLQHDGPIVRLWSDGGVFGATSYPMESLMKQVRESDFAVMVVGPDDKVESRAKISDAPRDNVIFEIGLFMGHLERSRTFLVMPRGLDMKIPTDLLGLTPLTYDFEPRDQLAHLIGSATNAIRNRIKKLGPK